MTDSNTHSSLNISALLRDYASRHGDYPPGHVVWMAASEIEQLVEQVETAQQEASDMRKAAAGMSDDLTRFGTAMVEAQDHLRPSHAAYRILGAALNPASEPTEGLPPDLARILRDPSITIDRDHEIRLADGRTLFEHLQEWRNAPSNTASAHVETETTPDASSVSTPAMRGEDPGEDPRVPDDPELVAEQRRIMEECGYPMPDWTPSIQDASPAKNSAGSESPGASEDTPTPGRDIAEEA